MNRFRHLLTGWNKKVENDEAMLHFAYGIIVWNKILSDRIKKWSEGNLTAELACFYHGRKLTHSVSVSPPRFSRWHATVFHHGCILFLRLFMFYLMQSPQLFAIYYMAVISFLSCEEKPAVIFLINWFLWIFINGKEFLWMVKLLLSQGFKGK